MIVISDTTPIISLLKINKLSLLQVLFKNVIIPQAVYNELVSNPKYTNEAVVIFNTSYISIKKVENRQQVDELRNNSGLDIGESEAITYSKMVNADLLLMDEQKGRSVAKQLGLSITGTIGILIQAFNENLISKEEILNSIKVLKESGRYISESLYNRLIARIS
jgi:predicted nucleic acid-binding protein